MCILRERNLNTKVEVEDLRRRVIAWECENQCCDIFVRVYLDRPAKKGFVTGRIPKEELLIFDSEEAAIQNGRFINRCRECFSKDG